MINYTGDKMTLFETEYIGNNRCNVYLCGVCIASYKIKNPYSPKAPDERWLEIGPGESRIPGFEGINIVKNDATDYIADVANQGITLPSNTFDLVYSSHFLEHIEWYKTEFVISEMFRVLKPGGRVEIHVPDGLKIAAAFVAAEKRHSKKYYKDGWWKFNPEHDPCVWAAGRIFTYGDGNIIKGHWNSHLAIFSYRYLKKLLTKAGFINIKKLKVPRGNDHGWINLGISGIKPE